MKNESEVQFAETGNRQGDTPASKPVDRHRFLKQVAGALAIFLLCSGLTPVQNDDNTLSRGHPVVDAPPPPPDVYHFAIGNPSRFEKLPSPGFLWQPVDSTPWT